MARAKTHGDFRWEPALRFFSSLTIANESQHSETHRAELLSTEFGTAREGRHSGLQICAQALAKYRDAMEAQHQRLSEDLSVPMTHLRPHSQLRLSDAGLEMAIRFPVPLDRAAAVDDEVTRSVRMTGAARATTLPR